MNANLTTIEWRKSIRDLHFQSLIEAIERQLDFDIEMTRWHWRNDGIADFTADILAREAREEAELADKCAIIRMDGRCYRISAQDAIEWMYDKQFQEDGE